MAGKRKSTPPAETMAKLTLLIPEEIDRDLRRHAHQTGQRVSPVVREMIITALTHAHPTERETTGAVLGHGAQMEYIVLVGDHRSSDQRHCAPLLRVVVSAPDADAAVDQVLNDLFRWMGNPLGSRVLDCLSTNVFSLLH